MYSNISSWKSGEDWWIFIKIFKEYILMKKLCNEKSHFLSSRLLLQWVQDGSPSHSTPIKVESPNQFVPLGTTKKEFKRVQQAVSSLFNNN